jgi:TATA-box binding protein (TBP) (component of TFIID and TFIIIB)
MNMDIKKNYEIVNIKCSSYISTLGLNYKHSYTKTKIKKSFFVIRSVEKPYVLCVFKSYINATGIRSFEEIETLKRILLQLFEIKNITLRIDNLTVRLNIKQFTSQLFLPLLADFLNRNKLKYFVDSVKFNPEIFSGLFLKFKNKKFGTVLFFKSAACMLLGCSEEKQVIITVLLVNKLIKRFVKRQETK